MAKKLIIAGSRTITDYDFLCDCMDFAFKHNLAYRGKIDTIISGAAPGVDTLAIRYAKENNFHLIEIPCLSWEWEEYGKKAGPMRNDRMAALADYAIVIHNNTSGSLNMISCMQKRNKYTVNVEYRKAYEWFQSSREMEVQNPST